MKIKSFFLALAALCCLSFSPSAKAQLNSVCFTANYSQYTTQTISADHAQIVQTVTVSGYTQGLQHMVYHGPQVGWVDDCAGMVNTMRTSGTHTLSMYNKLGTAGGNFSQGPTASLTNQTFSSTVSFTSSPGDQVSSADNGAVVCSIAGTIFGSAFNVTWRWNIEVAYTRVALLGGPQTNCYHGDVSTVCDIPAVTWCTPSTTVPDLAPQLVRVMVYPVPPPYYADVYAVCARPVGGSGAFICSPGIGVDLYTAEPLAYCTKVYRIP